MIAFTPAPDPMAMPDATSVPGSRRLHLVPEVGRAYAPAHVLPGTYRRRQALAAGFVATAMAVATMVLGALSDGARSVGEPALRMPAGTPYVVQPGDTLWSIAVRLDPNDDPRPMVDRLAADHGGALLRVGDDLWLPRV